MHNKWGTPVNNAALTPKMIVRFRLIRPLLDLVFLSVAAGLFVYFQFLSNTHHTTHSQHNFMGKLSTQINSNSAPARQPDIQLIDEQHTSEAAMWQSWVNWVKSTNATAGHCMFQPKLVDNFYRFDMLCFVNTTEHGSAADSAQWPPADSLFPRSVFSVPIDIKSPGTPSAETTTSMPVPKVQGWLNTAAGRKHFDPIAKKWLP